MNEWTPFHLGVVAGVAGTIAITAAFGWLFILANKLSDRAAQGRRFPE